MKVSYLTLIKRYIPILFIGIAISFASCEKTVPDPTEETEEPEEEPIEDESEYQEVNEWITEQMRTYYYWNNEIPPDRLLDFELAPPNFFETILSSKDGKIQGGEHYPFSWIQNVDDLLEGLQGKTTSTGINIMPIGYNYNANGDPENVFCVIRYVIPGSPADNVGIKRGDMFTEVNGSEMTPDNYRDLLAPYEEGKPFTISLASLSGNVLTSTGETIPLSVAEVNEPSVHHHSIITSASGKKIGYIFYNRFLNEKIDELFDVFTEFKSAGISDLILDLRYNLGGGVSASGALAAMIMNSYDKGNVFIKYDYNDRLNQQLDGNETFYALYPLLSKEIQAIINNDKRVPTSAERDAAAASIEGKIQAANLNLSTVYVLATDNSASASEIIIHNLAPYMEVIHIGDITYGKDVASISIIDEREPRRINWAMQPIITKLADKNGNGDYETGLIPDKKVDEFCNECLPLSPLGSKEDPLVLTALQMIDPAEAQTVQAKQMSISRSRTQKASFRVIEEFKEKNIKPLPVLLDNIQIEPAVIEQVKQQIAKP